MFVVLGQRHRRSPRAGFVLVRVTRYPPEVQAALIGQQPLGVGACWRERRVQLRRTSRERRQALGAQGHKPRCIREV